jgi:hypothetical protein
MPLAANALVTLAEGANALGLTTPSSTDASVEMLINQASQLAETTYCMRQLRKRTKTNLRLEGPRSCHLHPQRYGEPAPIDVASPVTVSVDGVVQTVWKSEADGPPENFGVQVYEDHFSRYLGWSSQGRIAENVVLTYSGGYDLPVPQDLSEAILELIQKLYGKMINRLPDVASLAGAGVSMQTIDGQWGGSATPVYALSKGTRDVFNAYRAWRIS